MLSADAGIKDNERAYGGLQYESILGASGHGLGQWKGMMLSAGITGAPLRGNPAGGGHRAGADAWRVGGEHRGGDARGAILRVLRDDGTVWLNLGDAYSGSGKGAKPSETVGMATHAWAIWGTLE